MLHTPICDYFGIKYPILLAGMGGVAMHRLVAAVSNAGGLGVIGAAGCSPEESARRNPQDARTHRQAVRRRPAGADSRHDAPAHARDDRGEDQNFRRRPVGAAGIRQARCTTHGMKIVVMCGKVHHGVKSQQAGADVVVAQGTEAGRAYRRDRDDVAGAADDRRGPACRCSRPAESRMAAKSRRR